MIIYKVENKVNNKKYIGLTRKSLEERKESHLRKVRNGSNTHFHNAIRKYGIDNFIWEVVNDTVDDIGELGKLEVEYISKYDSYNNGYNLTTGGESAYSHSDETKKKLRQINLGKVLSEETKEKIRQGNIGKEVTDEFRQRMRDMNVGRKLSKEAREKISKSLRGKPGRNTGNTHTNETKEKISKSRSGIPAHNRMRIVQKDMSGNIIREWASINEACGVTGVKNISSVLNGNRKSAGGYKWEKFDE